MLILFWIMMVSSGLALAFYYGRYTQHELIEQQNAQIKALRNVKGLTCAILRTADNVQVSGFDSQQMWYVAQACEGTYLVPISDEYHMIVQNYTDEPFDNKEE